jgi:hypothetical protein
MFFASFQWRAGIGKILAMTFGISAIINVVFALMRRVPILGKNLSYWDEAFFFMALSLAAQAVSK